MAFKKISKLTPSEFVNSIQLIEYQNSCGAMLKASIVSGKGLLTVRNELTVTGIATDLNADNGVVHLID